MYNAYTFYLGKNRISVDPLLLARPIQPQIITEGTQWDIYRLLFAGFDDNGRYFIIVKENRLLLNRD